MQHKLKTFIRNALSARYQVPTKFWYGAVRGDMEKEMALLGLLVRRGDHVIDVGGNRGTYAYRLWKLGAKVEVFEPNPDCARILEGWAAGKSGVAIHQVALSSRAGTAELHVPVDEQGVEHDASATIEQAHGERSRDHLVRLRPLDSYGFTDVALIKIDVEGHESSVIDGAAETLRASGPALIVEIEQRHNSRAIGEIFAQIEHFGYNGFVLLDGRLAPLHAFDLERHQSMESFAAAGGAYHNNFIFLHSDALAGGRYRALADRWMKK